MNTYMVYVNENDYFLSKLRVIENNINLSTTKFDSSMPYFATISGAYMATYLSGVSMQHLAFSSDVHPIITSIMKFHVYFWIRRFMTYPNLINLYLSQLEEGNAFRRRALGKESPIKAGPRGGRIH